MTKTPHRHVRRTGVLTNGTILMEDGPLCYCTERQGKSNLYWDGHKVFIGDLKAVEQAVSRAMRTFNAQSKQRRPVSNRGMGHQS